MKWLYLVTLDPQIETEVFFDIDEREYRVRRPCYRHLECTKCHKIDEVQALQTGLPPGFQADLDEGRDIQSTMDCIAVVSPRLRSILEDLGVAGVRFLECGRNGDAVIVPTLVAKTDAGMSKMDFRGRKPCAVCGRYSITCFKPSVVAMEFPQQTPAICTSSLRPENHYHSNLSLLMSADVAEVLRSKQIGGINWYQVDRTC